MFTVCFSLSNGSSSSNQYGTTYGELELFLCGLDLNQLVPLFQAQHVEFSTFLRLTEEDLIKVPYLAKVFGHFNCLACLSSDLSKTIFLNVMCLKTSGSVAQYRSLLDSTFSALVFKLFGLSVPIQAILYQSLPACLGGSVG